MSHVTKKRTIEGDALQSRGRNESANTKPHQQRKGRLFEKSPHTPAHTHTHTHTRCQTSWAEQNQEPQQRRQDATKRHHAARQQSTEARRHDEATNKSHREGTRSEFKATRAKPRHHEAKRNDATKQRHATRQSMAERTPRRKKKSDPWNPKPLPRKQQ